MDKLECPICSQDKSKYQCMVLINCRHTVCRSCLRQGITYCGSSGLRCPVADCGEWLQDAELKDISENTRQSIPELIPVANHWKWSDISREAKAPKKVLPKVEKKAEIPSHLSKKDFPDLTSSGDGEKSRLNNVRNVMDEPIPSGSKSYDSFKSSRNESREWNQNKFKGWDSENRIRLRRLIEDKLNKIVDFVFVASETDLRQNIGSMECLMCQETIRPYDGITFPYCSSYFCRPCVTQPERRVEDVILMYSDISDESKKCAVIIQGEMRRTLLERSKLGITQETIAEDVVPRNTVSSLVSIYENGNKKDSHDYSHNFETCTVSNNTSDRTLKQDPTPDDVLFRNKSSTSCKFCYKSIDSRKGVILRGCSHVLCERCLVDTIMETLKTGVEVRCPMLLVDINRRCETIVQEREIKHLLTVKQYKVYEKKCLEAAEGGFESSIHCLKPKCTGWVVIEGYKDFFKCPVCSSVNCLSCKAIHQGKPCSTYQTERKQSDDKDLSVKAKLMALDANRKTRCPICCGTKLATPRCNFIRCKECDHVFSLPTPESKL